MSAECPQQLGCTRALKCGPGRLDNRMYCPLGGTRWSGKSTPATPGSAHKRIITPQELWRDLALALGRPGEGEELHCVISTIGVVEVDLQGGKGADDAGERVNDIVDDKGLYSLQASRFETPTMDDLHLLHDGALARVAGAEQQKFDLTPLPLAF